MTCSTTILLILIVLSLHASALSAPLTVANEIVVAPTGDDAADGTEARPVATLGRAQFLARQAIANGNSVRVMLREGSYPLDRTLVFTPADSGTPDAPAVWEAAAGASVTISGGAPLKLRWQPHRDGIFKASVPADFTTDQLFVNGQLQQMARYPNYDPAQRVLNGYAADAISPERVQRWANPAGGYIHAMHAHLWGDYRYRVRGKNPDGTLQYEGGWQNNRQMGMHKEFRYVENIFEELDAPGEWYLDPAAQVIYFYPPPGTDLETAAVESVRLRHLIEFRGSEQAPVSNIIFSGLRFTQTARTFMDNREPLLRSDWTIYRGGAVVFEGASRCRIERCTFESLGGNAVFFSKYNRDCVVKNCRISEVGGNGVAFVGDPDAVRSPLFEYHQRQAYEAMDKARGPRTNNYPADCIVEDCLIYRTGRVEKQTAPVQIAMASRITIRHCSIYDVPRAGINIGDGCWGGHVIEFCDVFDTVRETGDHGSFNSWGRDRFWLPDIKAVDALVAAHPDLPTLDCIEPIVIRNNRWRCDHGWDIDLDDGASYYNIYNNLCLNGGIKNREGYGRRVENNILVNNSYHPHVWYANSGDVFRRNIVFGEYQPVGLERPWGAEFDQNLLHRAGASVESAKSLQEQTGRDKQSLLGDAHFVNPQAGDYRVKDDSPAIGLGFANFPMDRFGVVSPGLKRQARTPLPAIATQAGKNDVQTIRWLGADVKRVTTVGEMSATGLGRAEGVLLVRVPPDSVAAAAGLRGNDVILKVGSTSITSLEDFTAAVQQAANAGPLRLTVWRDQKTSMVELRETK